MREAVVSLDLEFNQPSGRIIQIGAVLGRISTGEVISLFETKVNPGEPLSDTIAVLTGIDADELDAAPDIHTAGRDLAIWLQQWDSVRQLNPLTWGGGDTQVLRTELGVNDERWLFGRRCMAGSFHRAARSRARSFLRRFSSRSRYSVIHFLNFLEEIAIVIYRGDADEEILKEAFEGVVSTACGKLHNWIHNHRIARGRPKIWIRLEELGKRWN